MYRIAYLNKIMKDLEKQKARSKELMRGAEYWRGQCAASEKMCPRKGCPFGDYYDGCNQAIIELKEIMEKRFKKSAGS